MTPKRIMELAEQATRPDEYVPDRLRVFCGGNLDDTNSSWANYYGFLYLLAAELRPNLMVELGTELGRAAFAMKLGCPDAEMLTFELGTEPPDTYMNYLASVKVRVHMGTDSLDWGLTRWGRRDLFGKIDLILFDTTHDYDQVMREWYLFRPLLAPGAVAVFDDYTHEGPTKLMPEIGFPKVIFDHNNPTKLHGHNGLAVTLLPT